MCGLGDPLLLFGNVCVFVALLVQTTGDAAAAGDDVVVPSPHDVISRQAHEAEVKALQDQALALQGQVEAVTSACAVREAALVSDHKAALTRAGVWLCGAVVVVGVGWGAHAMGEGMCWLSAA
jgi:hypothetical protein